MQIDRYIQQKIKPYPSIYKFCISIYSILSEIRFFIHALLSGKIFVKHDKNQFIDFFSIQKILKYPIEKYDFETPKEFRQWLEKNEIRYIEGGWTFYLPPQKKLNKYFNFLLNGYPSDSGLKILKDFQAPEEAKYTNHKQLPAIGASLKRYLTPSTLSLLRVANYLYLNGLGVKVYDLIALQGAKKFLTCYVVQHLKGPDVQQKDYDSFMKKMKVLLEKHEITTIHEKIDNMRDFKPPNCTGNLVMSDIYKKAIYVDFQGFLLLNEEKIFNRIINDVKEKVHFGNVRLFRGSKKYLYQSIPGIGIGKRDIETRWKFFMDMMEECKCSFFDKVVYDIGCNTGLMLYNALSEGAQWGVGWDLPSVIDSANRILLTLGATRFNLFGDMITEDTDFRSSIPVRYQNKKNGILFYLAVSNHIGFPHGVSELPWKYMFYEGHAKQDYKISLDRILNVPWLKKVTVITHRCFADGDTPDRVVILLKRKI